MSPATARLRKGVGALSVALFLLGWQVVGSTDLIRSDLISYPTEIAASFRQLAASGELTANVGVSLRELALGFAPAVAGGIALGVALALSRRLRALVDPLFVALYTAPAIAFVPLAVVWFGVGPGSKIAMVFLSAIMPIAINTTTGVNEVSEAWVRALRAFGATRWQVIAKAVLPGALPAIMAGLRLAIGRAIVSVVAAEMYVSVRGIGRLVQVYSTSDRAADIFVLVGIISAFGLASVAALRWIEAWLAPWRLSHE